MKKKILIDVIMTIFLVLLMKISFLNIQLHELIGILTFILFIVHKLFNLKTIKQTITKWKRISTKIKVGFILDIIIFMNFIVLFISSTIISNYIFQFLNIKDNLFWSDIHHFFAYTILILISIHIGFHFDNLLTLILSKLKINRKKLIVKYTLIVFSIFIIIFGIKVIFNNNFYKHLLKPFGYKDKVKKEIIKDKNNMTIEEYLKDKHCDGCSRHCLLTNLRCSKGQYYLEKAKKEYNKTININGNKILINTSLNIFDYFMVMFSIVGITHYVLMTKKIK